MDGVGQHFKPIIKYPQHNLCIPLMENKQVEEVVLAYRERYLTLREDPRFRLIIIFKNHGRGGGTSLEHPHSQLVAAPIVPLSIRYRCAEQPWATTMMPGPVFIVAYIREGLRVRTRTA